MNFTRVGVDFAKHVFQVTRPGIALASDAVFAPGVVDVCVIDPGGGMLPPVN